MTFVFHELAGKRIAVWGTGIEGRATLEALPRTAMVTILAEQTDDVRVRHLATEYGASVLTPGEALAAEPPDIVVRSPGVSVRRPELAAFRASGARVTTLLELWLPRAPASRVIGITGTKGKSTTASLVATLIAAAGRSVEVAGNMGVPPTHVQPCDFVVLEVSSYQAAEISVSPHIGGLTNLDVDHLPWHGTVDDYHRHKLDLFRHAELERLIVPPWSRPRVRQLAPSLQWTDFHFDVGDGPTLTRRGTRVADLEHTVLRPRHMAMNLAVACAVVESALDAPLDADLVGGVVHRFTLPPGRLEEIPTTDGIRWVNDPLASNPLAASAALRTYDGTPVVMILGGESRGVDPAPLLEALNSHGRVRSVILLDEAGDLWRPAIESQSGVSTRPAASLGEAVQVAAEIARSGDAVLFSPGAPTPKALGNWETRRDIFRDAVNGLNQSGHGES